jgi:sulfate permease, SulP family
VHSPGDLYIPSAARDVLVCKSAGFCAITCLFRIGAHRSGWVASKHPVVGPMSATAALSAAIIGPIAGADPARFVALTAALAVVTGIVGLLVGLVRFGFIAAFISEPVLKGFIVGLALTIIVGQVPKLLGVQKAGGDTFQRRGASSPTWEVLMGSRC